MLIGLRALVPAGELVDALRAEKMLTVAAGDNVVRLLPPLIISEQEIAEGVRAPRSRLRAASGAHAKRAQQETAAMSGVRHFLDLIDVPAADLRGMIESARAMKSKRAPPPDGRSPARRWR